MRHVNLNEPVEWRQHKDTGTRHVFQTAGEADRRSLCGLTAVAVTRSLASEELAGGIFGKDFGYCRACSARVAVPGS